MRTYRPVTIAVPVMMPIGSDRAGFFISPARNVAPYQPS